VVVLAIAMQLQITLQIVPATRVPPKQYDVDIQVLRATDTVMVPGVRLADGLEGRLMFARESGVTLQVHALVQEDLVTKCRVVTVGFGEVLQERDAVVNIPQTTGRLCEGDIIRMKSETGSTIVATVRAAKIETKV
jgi:hypothetical protein